MREPENDEGERLRWRDHAFRRQEAQGERDPERGARGSGVAKPWHIRARARAFSCCSLVFRMLTFHTLHSTVMYPTCAQPTTRFWLRHWPGGLCNYLCCGRRFNILTMDNLALLSNIL